MEPLTQEQEAKLQELKKRIFPPDAKDKWPPHVADAPEGDQEIFLQKNLISRKWNVDNAQKMIVETVAHRKEYSLDTNPQFPPAFPVRGWNMDELVAFEGKGSRDTNSFETKIYNAISPFYACAYHKWDKDGRPVWIEQIGRVNAKGLVESYKPITPPGKEMTEIGAQIHVHCNAVGALLSRFQDAKMQRERGSRVLQVTAIMDMQGLGFHTLYKPALQLFKTVQKMDESFYPEGLHRLYCVNCPSMMPFAFNIVKGWIDPRVRGKIIFLKPEQIDKLQECIDAENLPNTLGGTCQCEGECTPYPSGVPETPTEGETVTEEIKVSRGHQVSRDIDATSGETVSWEFATKEHNISFSVKFEKMGENHEELVVEPEKVTTGDGSFTAPADGRVTLVFDNSFSVMRGKTINLRFFKMD